jgi:hypothetical protein
MTDGDTLTTGGKWLVGGGIIVALGGLLAVIDALEADPPRPIANRTIAGSRRVQREFAELGPVSSATVNVSTATTDRAYSTNDAGAVSIDLVRDLGWRWFEEPTTLQLRVTSPLDPRPLVFELSVQDWLAPCVRTIGRGNVQQRPTAAALRLGEHALGETFPLLDATVTDWYGVQYRGAPGWIPKLAAKRCWSAVPLEQDARR